MAWIAIVTVVLTGFCSDLQGQTEEAERRQAETAQTLNPAATDQGDAPASSFANRWFTVPVEKRPRSYAFPWMRFAVVLLGFFLWLRITRLSLDDAKFLTTAGWTRCLFGFGSVGTVAAIFLPALFGAGVLVATCGVPFWRYLVYRNRNVADTVPRLAWSNLLFPPRERFMNRNRVALELSSNASGTADNRRILLLGNSQWSHTVPNGDGETEKPATGFQRAVALIDQAVAKQATDLHLSTKENEITARLRIDGELVALDPLPFQLGSSVINVFKVLCDLNIADKRRSQDGSFRADVDGRRLSFRVSAQGTSSGEKLSIRILDPAYNFYNFSSLGMTEEMQRRLKVALDRRFGLIVFAGATGAGKSTTAYAALRSFDAAERNIMTIEDPIEYSIPSIDQVEVNARAGQTFQSGLRSLLRQDADVVLVGEIRDAETCQTACQAATTGQLVLATLHANDSVSAVFRLLDLGSDRHTVAAAMRASLSQQLVRRLCPHCRIEYQAGDPACQSHSSGDFEGTLFRRPDPLENSCLQCNGRGFLGRTGIFELLEVTQPIRDLIRGHAGASEILAAARDAGMTTLRDDGMRLVREGIISVEDFDRFVGDP